MRAVRHRDRRGRQKASLARKKRGGSKWKLGDDGDEGSLSAPLLLSARRHTRRRRAAGNTRTEWTTPKWLNDLTLEPPLMLRDRYRDRAVAVWALWCHWRWRGQTLRGSRFWPTDPRVRCSPLLLRFSWFLSRYCVLVPAGGVWSLS